MTRKQRDAVVQVPGTGTGTAAGPEWVLPEALADAVRDLLAHSQRTGHGLQLWPVSPADGGGWVALCGDHKTQPQPTVSTAVLTLWGMIG